MEAAEAMVQRNCTAPMQLCHHLAPAMVARGSGGIVIFGSDAGLAGGPNMVAYGASKAFDMVFAEALWAELLGLTSPVSVDCDEAGTPPRRDPRNRKHQQCVVLHVDVSPTAPRGRDATPPDDHERFAKVSDKPARTFGIGWLGQQRRDPDSAASAIHSVAGLLFGE